MTAKFWQKLCILLWGVTKYNESVLHVRTSNSDDLSASQLVVRTRRDSLVSTGVVGIL